MAIAIRACSHALLAIVVMVLAGCTGEEVGVGSGGTGGGPTSSVTGAVTGFGSIFIDGQAWDDRAATVEVELDPRQAAVPAEVGLGQRVEIESSMAGAADRIRLQAAVVGRVSEVMASATPPTFKVAGQTVRLNADANAGPVTVVDGYASLAQMAVNDAVEVHGVPVFDTATSRNLIVASRVQKLASLPGGLLRIAGVVEGYQPASAVPTFRLGELTVSVESNTVVVPANRALANGQSVVVASNKAITAGPRLAADAIRIRDRMPAGGPARTELSGVVSRYDPAAASFEIAGVPVDARAARITPANQQLANNLYVIVGGSFNGNGVLVAESVRIRSRGNNDVEVELRGTITDYVSIASFKVRDVLVNGTGARVSDCPVGLANDLYVELKGRVEAPSGAVRAEQIECKTPPGAATLTVTGLASAVNATARTFTVTPTQGAARSVQWTPITHFTGTLSPANLEGTQVEVEGYGSGAVLVAKKVKRKN